MRLSRLVLLLIATPLLIAAQDPNARRPTRVIRQPRPAPAAQPAPTIPAPPPNPTDLTAAISRPPSGVPLPILTDPLAECRRACSPSYYRCLGGDDASSCSAAWLQCRADCARPAPVGH